MPLTGSVENRTLHCETTPVSDASPYGCCITCAAFAIVQSAVVVLGSSLRITPTKPPADRLLASSPEINRSGERLQARRADEQAALCGHPDGVILLSTRQGGPSILITLHPMVAGQSLTTRVHLQNVQLVQLPAGFCEPPRAAN